MADDLREIADIELANELQKEMVDESIADGDAIPDGSVFIKPEIVAKMDTEEKRKYWEKYFCDPDRAKRNLINATKSVDKWGNKQYLFGLYWVSVSPYRLIEVAKQGGNGYIIVCRLYDGKFVSRKCSSILDGKAMWLRRIHRNWYGFVDPDNFQIFV